MRLSEYFGMKLCYSTLKTKKHVFHRSAGIFFFRNGELLKITLEFHKNYQNIFQNDAVFFTKYTYLVGFPFMWWGIFSSIEWAEKIIKIFDSVVFEKINNFDFFPNNLFSIGTNCVPEAKLEEFVADSINNPPKEK